MSTPKSLGIRSAQMDTAVRLLTDGTFSRWTGRKVPAMTVEQASALIGNAMHETGSRNLTRSDVVEQNAGAGRGLMQYTGPRRTAYDRANPGNDIRKQLQYAAEEYAGKHDPAPGASLIGYTKSLETTPKRDVKAATTHLMDNYFRPADPNASREERIANAMAVAKMYKELTKPKSKSLAVKSKQTNPVFNALKIFGSALGIR